MTKIEDMSKEEILKLAKQYNIKITGMKRKDIIKELKKCYRKKESLTTQTVVSRQRPAPGSAAHFNPIDGFCVILRNGQAGQLLGRDEDFHIKVKLVKNGTQIFKFADVKYYLATA